MTVLVLRRSPGASSAAAGRGIPLLVAGIALARRLADARRAEPDDAADLAVRGLRDLRHRLRPRQRADHQRRRLGHAARAGRRRRGDRHHLAADRAGASAWRSSARSSPRDAGAAGGTAMASGKPPARGGRSTGLGALCVRARRDRHRQPRAAIGTPQRARRARHRRGLGSRTWPPPQGGRRAGRPPARGLAA